MISSRSLPLNRLFRRSIALAHVLLLGAWVEQRDAVVVPYNHPANPHAPAAPPIAIPGMRGPELKEIIPDPAKETPSSPRSSGSSSSGDGARTQHQHF
ncbi:MAG: hypothetical protein HZA66_05580 [Rhodopseudomonas palustris]|uniref:Uncharacterized protein n=1 Tax=Rhodopseudomonas palustris TaxID=1076 RepID=A0A933RV95_RHOPL|nr:hypothetical protein [Rhodopseudomonas palustris]